MHTRYGLQSIQMTQVAFRVFRISGLAVCQLFQAPREGETKFLQKRFFQKHGPDLHRTTEFASQTT